MLKVDLHVHTIYSGDALIGPEEAVLWAKKAGLDGLAITDHDTLRGAERARPVAEREGVVLIPGVEVESRGGHILALGVSEPPEPGGSLAEVLEAVEDQGGVSVLAHPFNLLAPRGWSYRELVRLDAVEVVNASQILFPISRRLAVRLAEALGKPMVAGSDAHLPEAVGKAFTIFEACGDEDDLLEALRKGMVRPCGGRMELSLILRKMAIPSYL